MAGKIKGITIELDGDTTGLDKALKGVNKEASDVAKELKLVERGLKFDPSNVELLRQKQELLGESITGVTKKLDILKSSQSQIEAQFQSGDIGNEQYRAFQRELLKTEGQLESFQNKLKGNNKVVQESKRDFNELGKSVEDAGNKMSGAGAGMTAGLTAPLVAVGGVAVNTAKQFDDASTQIQNSLGLVGAEAEKVEEVAKNVWKNGFGEDLNEVTDAIVRVKQNMQGLGEEDLEKATKSAMALAKTFDSDVNEVTRAGNNLMQNFGIDSEKAFDMMTKGAQNGMNFSNEMFDNLSEYSPLFNDMGFSAEEMFGILQAGADKGVYNFDYLNDVMKEFGIRINDGSKSTFDAMAGMNEETQKMFEQFQAGEVTASDMFTQITGDLSTMENQMDQNILGTALFGTKWEDLGGDVVLAMGESSQAFNDFEGSMDSVIQKQEETFGTRWDSMMRTAGESLLPLGEILLQLAEDWLPKIIGVITILAGFFAGLDPILQVVVTAFGLFLAVLGPLLIVLGPIVTAIGTLIPLFASGGAVATVFGAVMGALTGPIGLVILAIVGIVTALVVAYQKIEWFRDGINAIWEIIKEHTMIVFEAIKTFVTEIITGMVDTGKELLDKFKDFWAENGEFITAIVKTAFQYIKDTITTTMTILGTVIKIGWEAIKLTFKTVTEGIKLVVKSFMDIILGTIQTVMKLLQGDWEGAWETVKQTAVDLMQNVIDFFDGIDLVQAGKDMIGSLIKGITEAGKGLLTTVGNLVSNVVGSFGKGKKQLEKEAPSGGSKSRGIGGSQVMSISENTPQMAMARNTPTIQSAMDNVIASVGSSSNKSMNLQQMNREQSSRSGTNNDLSQLIQAVMSLANRPVETVVNMDGRAIADSVSTYQYNDSSILAMTRGAQI